MDFIVAASNLRAENYDIPPTDRHKVGIKSLQNLISLINNFRTLLNITFYHSEQTDSWQDHSRHRNYDSCCGGPGVSGALQNCPRTAEAGVLQERLHEPGAPFLRFL